MCDCWLFFAAVSANDSLLVTPSVWVVTSITELLECALRFLIAGTSWFARGQGYTYRLATIPHETGFSSCALLQGFANI